MGNRLDSGTEANFSASLALYGDFAQVRNVLVQRNRFVGGGFCVYGGSSLGKPYPLAAETRFLDNVFARDIHTNCGFYGPAVAYYNGNSNQWNNNRWEDGLPVDSADLS